MDSFVGDNIEQKFPFKYRGICCCDKRKNIDKNGKKCYNIKI